MRVDERAPDDAAEMRLRDIQRKRAVVVAFEPDDVAETRIVQASRDRRARAGKLAHRGLELGELVFVAAEVADPFRRERDPRDRVGEPLPRELDRQPAVVARAHARGYSYAVLGGPGDRHEQRPERIEHLRRPFERALDVGADALGGFRSSW